MTRWKVRKYGRGVLGMVDVEHGGREGGTTKKVSMAFHRRSSVHGCRACRSSSGGARGEGHD